MAESRDSAVLPPMPDGVGSQYNQRESMVLPPPPPPPPGVGGTSPIPPPPRTPAPPPAPLPANTPVTAPPPSPCAAPKPPARAGLLESMQDEEITADQDTRDVKYGDYSNKTVELRPIYPQTESLRALQQTLIQVAERCKADYSRQEIQKNPAQRLEVVKSTTSAIAAALHQLTREINHVATDFCQRLEEQGKLLDEMKQQTYWVEMKAGISLHRKDLNHLRKFAKKKNKPYTPLCYKGIMYPKEKPAPRVKAARMPGITYDRLDDIGHGVQIDDAVLSNAVTEMFVYGRRPSTISTRSVPTSNRESRLSQSSVDSTSSTSTIDSSSTAISGVPASARDSVSSQESLKMGKLMNTSVGIVSAQGQRAVEEAPELSTVGAMRDDTGTCEEDIYANYDVEDEFNDEFETTHTNEETAAVGGATAAVKVVDEYADDEFIYMNEEIEERPVVSRRGVERWAPAEYLFKGVVLYEYVGQSAEELTISYGETIYVTWLEENDGPWCQGMTVNGCGLVPLNYIQRGNTPDEWISRARDSALRESFI